jgi:epoxyqueuosine reductase
LNLTDSYLKKLIKDTAANLGFFKTGFARVETLVNESEHLQKWLSLGYDVDMNWIGRNYEKRKDMRLIMPEAKTVISLAYNYYTPYKHETGKPKISRYAWGKDYHKIIKKKLKELAKFIEELGATNTLKISGSVITKYYIDDGPVMDKAWAVHAGIGWMGKHTNVIDPEHGSWFFLSEIITNLELDTYDEPIEDMCGKCRLCIDACPTGAIVDDYQLDSNLCISYQTIENRREIPGSILLHGWVFGCDICQDVCPFNTNPIPTDNISFYPKEELYVPPLRKGGVGKFRTKEELESITEDQFNTIFFDSPIRRTKFSGWKRNLDRINDESC